MQITTLASDCTAEDLTLTVSASGVCPANQSFIIQIDTEKILVTSVSTVTLTVIRAYNGTIASSHVAGDPVALILDDKYTKDLTAYVDTLATDGELAVHAALDSDVHGAGVGETILNTGDVVDEDDMSSDDDTKVPTQQSVKAYTDLRLLITDIDDTPVDNEIAQPISSNWAYDHNAAALSSTVHPNTGIARAYTSGSQSYCPTSKLFRIQLNAVNFDRATPDNFEFGYIFNQTQSDADSDATHIQDDDGAFTTATGQTNGLLYALVTWSSDAGGTLNTGSGYITSVAAAVLGIYKTNGDNFAASYYYTIKQAWYKAPVTGIYLASGLIRFSSTNMVADKLVQLYLAANNDTWWGSTIVHTSVIGAMYLPVLDVVSLTANDLLVVLGWHNTGADNVIVSGATSLAVSLIAAA